ncbi:MAG: T9SS type A sorting domain-containing protein [Weeksellaceae bacterium]
MLRPLLFSFLMLGMFLQAQVTIGDGTISQSIPLYSTANFSYSQSIYPKNSIGNSGEITGIEYMMSSGTTSLKGMENIEIYMKNVEIDTFTNQGDLVLEDLTLVHSGAITLSSDNKIIINFEKPFTYDNNYNLLIAVKDLDSGYGSYSTSFLSTAAATYSSYKLYDITGKTPIDPSMNDYSKQGVRFLPNITLNGIEAPSGDKAPNCTKVVTPENGGTNVNFLPVIYYEKVSNADKYFVSLGTTPGGTDIYDMEDNGNYTDFYVNNELTPETEYFVTVYPSNAAGTNTTCESSSFTTGSAVSNDDCANAIEVNELPYKKIADGEYSSALNGNVICENKLSPEGYPFEVSDGVWYAIKGDGSTISVAVTPLSFWDASIAIKQDCDTGDCLEVSEKGSFKEAESLSFLSEKDKTYYLVIGIVGGLPMKKGKFEIDISSNLSTSEVAFNAIEVFPNPTQDVVNVIGIDAELLSLYDMNGALVGQAKNTNEISLSSQAAGVYILHITAKDGNVITQKVIKK